MSGLFEHLAATEDFSRTAGRKAVALARARADKRFARFIHGGANVPEQRERLALVAGDLEQTIKEACAEVEYTDWEGVRDTVLEHFGFTIEGNLFTEEDAFQKEARRPKMCPFHREVTDISLAAGDPTAGFSSMAQHAYGPMSCRGEFEGGCNFKPEMVTQTYWDQKAEKAEQRRQEREQQIQQQQQTFEQPEEVAETTINTEPVENAIEGESFNPAPEPSAVGVGPEPQMAMAAHTAAGATIPGDQTGALERVDIETYQNDGPADPKMDKRKWTPENVRPIDAEMDGSPHPTREQDIVEPAIYKGRAPFEDDGRFEQTNAVTEKQDVEQKADYQGDKAHGTWPSNHSDRSAVSATQDPDKNPIRESIIDFPSEDELARAIEEYNG